LLRTGDLDGAMLAAMKRLEALTTHLPITSTASGDDRPELPPWPIAVLAVLVFALTIIRLSRASPIVPR
jgi:hypothetical protein